MVVGMFWYISTKSFNNLLYGFVLNSIETNMIDYLNFHFKNIPILFTLFGISDAVDKIKRRLINSII